MLVQCALCGGETPVEPGQKMLACSFCGASIALEESAEAEHIILAHARRDDAAGAALVSHLLERGRGRPTGVKTEFAYLPFWFVEDEKGEARLAPAARAWRHDGAAPYPPAGEYRYFDESASNEKIVPAENPDPAATKLVHLPVYTIRYETGPWRGRASIVGESWQVVADDLPPERPRRPAKGLVLGAAGLFAAYFLVARLAPNVVARFALVAAAAGAAYLAFVVRERARE